MDTKTRGVGREVLPFRPDHEVIMKCRIPDENTGPLCRPGWIMLLVRADTHHPFVACHVFDGDEEWWQGSYCAEREEGVRAFVDRVRKWCHDI